MTQLTWDTTHAYEEGIERGVLYSDGVGVSWSGLIAVNETETDTVDTTLYFDGKRRLVSQQTGEFEGSIEAYMYPDEFAQYDGYSERELDKLFGLSYRSNSKIHLIYNIKARPGAHASSTVSDSLEASSFVWDISTEPIAIPGCKPGSHLIIDIGESSNVLSQVEGILYGTSHSIPRLPTPSELIDIFETETVLRVRYLNNISTIWEISGPDNMVQSNPDGSFWISAPTLQLLTQERFSVSSY